MADKDITLKDIEKALNFIDTLSEEKIESSCGCYITVKGNMPCKAKLCEAHLKEGMEPFILGQKKLENQEEVKIYGISIVSSILKDLLGEK